MKERRGSVSRGCRQKERFTPQYCSIVASTLSGRGSGGLDGLHPKLGNLSGTRSRSCSTLRVALRKLLAAGAGTVLSDDNHQLLPIARALVTSVAQLNAYARRTNRIPQEVGLVRQVILQAKDPRSLLFVELPDALQLDITDS